jgi:uncharacterized membrane protein
MEGLIILVVLALVGGVIILPIAAFVRSGRALREAEHLRHKLASLDSELRRLKRQFGSEPPSPGAPEDILETPVTAMPPVPVPATHSETPVELPPAEEAMAETSAAETAASAARPTSTPHPPPLPPVFAASPPVTPSTATSAPAARPLSKIDWEQFMGVKLFAWLGGFALFLAVGYFVKYSFEHDLIPPEVRVALGFLVGLGLLVGGVVLKQRRYAVTSQTLCATGVVVLYAVTFACRAVYHFAFFGPLPTFLLMVLITATAFTLAVRLDAMVVAILGMLGGFLTPILLSTGQDNAPGLFTYIALLDAGLIAVALTKRWHFLVALAALGTAGMELGWSEKFFTVEKIVTAIIVLLGFDALFLGGNEVAHRRKGSDRWFQGAAAGLALLTLLYALFLLRYQSLGQRPALLGTLVLGADLCLLALTLREPRLAPLQLLGGALAHLFIAVWTVRNVSDDLLFWGLGLVLVFAVLHSVFPVVLQRLRPHVAPVWWSHLFPPLALLLILIPLFKLATVSILIWPVILLVDLLAIGLAIVTASLVSIVAVLVLTVLVAAAWIFRIPVQNMELPAMLIVVGGMAIVFLFAGLFAMRKVFARLPEGGAAVDPLAGLFAGAGLTGVSPEALRAQLPALSALLPFLLLILIVVRMPLPNPSPVFALALALVALLLSVARTFRVQPLAAVSLGCALALEAIWHLHHFDTVQAPAVALLWYLGFAAAFVVFPFVSREQCRDSTLPWSVAALSAPLHFPLIYRVVSTAWPNSVMGLLPAAFALPLLGCVLVLLNWFPTGHPRRLGVLAWFGGAALFFITLIFPIQFERQWITVGWALEGAALCWLFHRVPHPGLRVAGVGLLAVAFARLALNPAVLEYHPRSATAILNWYLYAYGITTAALFVAARLLAPPRDRIGTLNAPPLLNALGVILAFLLLNLEIADYFTNPGEPSLVFRFSGNFARDMTYTIAWALFALGLVVAGIWRQLRAARYAGLALLSVTLLKLFFHDLARLNQLYRIGALAAVAVVAIFASFLYQKFLAPGPGVPKEAPPAST